MAKLINLPLEELYDKPKKTKAVLEAILAKDDFSKANEQWCSKVCTLKCKSIPRDSVLVPQDPVDILIIQNNKALPDFKFGRSSQAIENKHKGIIQHLFRVALSRENLTGKVTYSVTNLTRCNITGPDIVKGKPPSGSVLAKCRPYLFSEIEKRNPKVIISLTTEVTRVLGSNRSNNKNSGEIVYINTKGKDIPLVLTLHPKSLVMLRQNASGAFWGPDFYNVIIRDFQKAIKIYSGELRVPNLEEALEKAKKQIIICRSIAQVKYWGEKLQEIGLANNIISFDIESTGLDRYAPDAKILTLQFGWRRETDGILVSIVIPLWHRCNTEYDPEEAWGYLIPTLINPNIKKIGHNAKFDITYIHAVKGVMVQGLFLDTMLLLHSMESGIQGMYGLKKAVWDWLPETELGGYEDKLPKLTKLKKPKSLEDIEDIEEEEEVIIDE